MKTEMKLAKVKDFSIGKKQPLTLILGPCVIESEELCMSMAEQLKELCLKKGVNFIFKSSYDKANRSAYDSYRGPGVVDGLEILNKVKKALDVPVVTDVHSPEEAKMAAEVCDMLQIPAFLSRQTDLIVTAAETGRAISVKKGQFMAPWDVINVIEKVYNAGNTNLLLIERGFTLGYNNLVSDMRAIPIMQSFGVPVCFDATHSVQLPGGLGNASGGQREFVATLARAAIAAGADCIFCETHPDPVNAKSDAATQIPIHELSKEIDLWVQLYNLIQSV